MRDVIVIGARVAGSPTASCWRARAWTCWWSTGRAFRATRGRGGRRSQLPHQAAAVDGLLTYWEGVDCPGGEIYSLERRSAGAWPTNDGLVMTYVGWPIDEFKAFRAESKATSCAPWTAPAGIMLGKLFSGRRRAVAAMP
jgi:hypothetical protein